MKQKNDTRGNGNYLTFDKFKEVYKLCHDQMDWDCIIKLTVLVENSLDTVCFYKTII